MPRQSRKARQLLTIVSGAMVLAFLLASLGIPVSTHWCHGRAMDVRLFAAASTCMAENASMAAAIEKTGCCEDQQVFQKAEGLENDGTRLLGLVPSLQNLQWAIAWLTPQLFADKAPKVAFDVPTHRERSSGRAVYALSESWLI